MMFKRDHREHAKGTDGTIVGKSFGANTEKPRHFCYIKMHVGFSRERNQFQLINSLRGNGKKSSEIRKAKF